MGIDVLVPVLGRPGNAQPLADSLKVTQTPYRLIFVCSPRDVDEQMACLETGAEVLVTDWNPHSADFAKKINWAFERTDAEWVFQGADDIRFSPDWDLHALKLAERTRRRVIGTNDLHNPSVRRKLHSTHTLFARSYIEEQGGTEDDSGTVFCELYDHQYVDNEFIEVARRRGEFISSPRSIVEHFHPHWGNAERDPTYVKAFRGGNADRQLYMQRMGLARRQGRYTRSR